MRQIFILALSLIATASYGQTATDNPTSKIVPVFPVNETLQPAYFVDGKFASGVLLDPQLIYKINVVSGKVQVDNRQYNGQIYITTKTHDGSRLISLTELKNKYTKFKKKPVIFFIDESVVKGDYNKYVVDERYVLQIKVDTVTNPTENIDLAIINVHTKSDANIKKSKEIRIRGDAILSN
jgi:hypothetical protein